MSQGAGGPPYGPPGQPPFGGYGPPPGAAPAPQPGYGAPQPNYGAQPPGYGAPPQGGYGPPPQGGYAPAPQGGYGPAPQGGYGPPPQGGYGPPPQGGYGPQMGYPPPPAPGPSAPPAYTAHAQPAGSWAADPAPRGTFGDTAGEHLTMKRGRYSAWAYVVLAFLGECFILGAIPASILAIVMNLAGASADAIGFTSLGVGFVLGGTLGYLVFRDRWRCIEAFSSRFCVGLVNISILFVPVIALVYANVRGVKKLFGT